MGRRYTILNFFGNSYVGDSVYLSPMFFRGQAMARVRNKKSSSEIEEVADKPIRKKKKIKPKACNLLSSGSTLLNLGLSDNPFGAFLPGHYYWFVGDSDTGKTIFSMTCFAEALQHQRFKNCDLIYDNVEGGMLMDLDNLFNENLSEQILPPSRDEYGMPVSSYSIEDFYFHVDDRIKLAKHSGNPFIYILDSMDGLTSVAADDKFDQQKDAYRRGKTVAGSYGDGKAKKNSEGLRKVLKGLRDTKSILIIISQTRDNISGRGFQTKTVSGGHSLKFYATTQIWTSLAGTLKRSYKGKDRQIGINVKIQVRKNRITGRKHDLSVDIYHSLGIDDIGSCIDYLIMEKWWTKKKQSIIAKEFGVTASRDKLISHIEENGLYKDLQKITGRCWHEIQNAVKLKRRNRYALENKE